MGDKVERQSGFQPPRSTPPEQRQASILCLTYSRRLCKAPSGAQEVREKRRVPSPVRASSSSPDLAVDLSLDFFFSSSSSGLLTSFSPLRSRHLLPFPLRSVCRRLDRSGFHRASSRLRRRSARAGLDGEPDDDRQRGPLLLLRSLVDDDALLNSTIGGSAASVT